MAFASSISRRTTRCGNGRPRNDRALALAAALVLLVSGTAEAGPLTVTLEAQPEYVVGFPMVMVVTVADSSPSQPLDALSAWTLLSPSAPLDFEFTDQEGHVVWARSSAPRKETPRGFVLLPGQARRLPYDVSALRPALHPGTWRAQVHFHEHELRGQSSAVPLRVAAPDGNEAKALAQLLYGVADESWPAFLAGNWRTVARPSLSVRSERLVALHLFLHRVMYGPEPVAQAELTWLAPLEHGLFEPEAATFKHEILLARKDAHAATVAAEIVRRWPALSFRVDAAARGLGFLQGLREFFGAERALTPRPTTTPYAR
jgi:hypothetical protein